MRRFFALFFALTVLSVNAQNFRVEILNSADEIKLCPLDDYIFRVKALFNEEEVEAKFSWDFAEGSIFTTNEPFYEYRYKTGGTYKISVKADYGDYSATAYQDVIVGIKPSFKKFSADKDNICLGEKITLSMPIKDSVTEYFTSEYDLRRAVWSGRGVSATKEGVAECTPPEYGTTRYVFTIEDNFGCYYDTAVFMEVEKPSFQGATEPTVFIGDEINFESKTSWANSFTWDFGDKTPKENANTAPHAYYEQGIYQVIFEGISETGCVDRDTQTVKIVPRPLEVKEVNIFTPNGDGQNDVFTFFNPEDSFLKNGGLTQMPANIRSIKGKIYNSFGQTVYKWNEVETAVFGWDGTIDNKGNRECPPGTYFYDIIVYGKDGTHLKRSGTIFLYRSK
ncbi:MAG: gliding motility-associated C-terminal domain-containing protein [Bacteroidales bacterium]|nr:gliding motility-associated C-terminal domain-containing protein [Bacteroidales bacterium]